MKEDVLEQIVDDYLQLNGYFTVHNVRFKPSSDCAIYGSTMVIVHTYGVPIWTPFAVHTAW